jgi:nucleotide-binding universal stress UspA family protein
MQNFKNILIASDFSKHSDNAIEFTKNIHKKLGSQVSLIHISDVSLIAFCFEFKISYLYFSL